MHEREQRRDKQQRRHEREHGRSGEVSRAAFLADVTQYGAELSDTAQRDSCDRFTAQGIHIGGENPVHGVWADTYDGVVFLTRDCDGAALLHLTRRPTGERFRDRPDTERGEAGSLTHRRDWR
jgi:hypothetical protein